MDLCPDGFPRQQGEGLATEPLCQPEACGLADLSEELGVGEWGQVQVAKSQKQDLLCLPGEVWPRAPVSHRAHNLVLGGCHHPPAGWFTC